MEHAGSWSCTTNQDQECRRNCNRFHELTLVSTLVLTLVSLTICLFCYKVDIYDAGGIIAYPFFDIRVVCSGLISPSNLAKWSIFTSEFSGFRASSASGIAAIFLPVSSSPEIHAAKV